MSAAHAHLALHPERCDRCGLCVRACPGGRLKVGGGFIYVDVQDCDGCFACVEVCDRAAIVRAPTRPVALARGGGKVVVGSRVEAKALKAQATAAEQAAAAATRDARRPPWTRIVDSAKASAAKSAGSASGTWGLIDAAIVATFLLIAIAFKDAAMGSPAIDAMPPVGRVVAGTLVLAVFYAAQMGVLSFLAWRKRASFSEAFRLRTGFEWSRALPSAVIVVALAIGTRMVSLLWGAVARAAGWQPPLTQDSSFSAVFGPGLAGLALAVLMAVIVGPITEELAFRGVIAPALERRFGRTAAIAGSAGVFALYHVTPWLFVPMFAFGCALGWLALSRRSLWSAIALHATYNGVVVAAAFWLAR